MSARSRAIFLAIAVSAAIASAVPAQADPNPARAATTDSAYGVDAVVRGPSVEERLDQIRARIQAALVYPPIARKLGLEGVAWVQFTIDHGGAAHDVDLARSSGHPLLDQAARRTVDRAGRLPWVHGRIEVPIRFSLKGPT